VLAASGMRVALVDKARFPRDKLCGGLLSERSLDALRQVFDTTAGVPIEITSTGAAAFDRGCPLVAARNCPPMHFTSRRTFDAALVELAVARGATLLEGSGVAAFDRSRRSVELSDGRTLTAPFVVGADGASSRVRRLLGVATDRAGFAVGLEIEVPRASFPRDVPAPEIYFGLVDWGYAWVFPKRESLTVGIGGLAERNADMRACFRNFASIVLGRVPDQRPCGSPIPFGNFLRRPGAASTLLIGDAAGLVEPLTGEGIAYAVQSGQDAAHAIVEAARRNAPESALRLYMPRYRRIVRGFRDARWLRGLVFSGTTRALFLRALQNNDRMVHKHMDVLAGTASYRDYARFAIGETVRHLPGLWRRAMETRTSR
jgi:geranylgeranyl reductase family protein